MDVSTDDPEVPEQPGELEQASSKRALRGGRRLKIAGLAVLALGLMALGAAGGSVLWPRPVVVRTVEVTPTAAAEEVTAIMMPDVLGLTGETARLVLTDAGLRGVPVTVTEEPFAGAPGVVLAQDPLGGSDLADLPSEVRLTLAAATTTPDLVGQDAGAARAALEELGARVRFEYVVGDGSATGTVVRSAPSAGEALPAEVVLGVADPGESVYLTSLDIVRERERCSKTSSVQVDGDALTSSYECRPSSAEPDGAAAVEFVLGRNAVLVSFTLGADDFGEAGSATVRLLADGLEVYSGRATHGESEEVSVPVRDALILRVVVSAEDAAIPTVVLGELRATGEPDLIAQLAGQ
ncbi:MAG: PASTA domain-containing protein [Actinobacteria bacterium]|nr:PASTA domain-containing protein [Actinomycetota bacterium]